MLHRYLDIFPLEFDQLLRCCFIESLNRIFHAFHVFNTQMYLFSILGNWFSLVSYLITTLRFFPMLHHLETSK